MKGYIAKLDSWFGGTDYTVIHTWFEPSAAAPTLFAVVKTEDEIMFIRVHNASGRLQVHADKRILINEI